MRRTRLLRFLCFIASLLLVTTISSCSRSKPVVEQSPTVQTAPTATTQEPAVKPNESAPPELNAVEAAVKRIFKDAVTVDTSRNPAFVSGDFNGDQSVDIAVVVKPSAEKIAELNEEYPNWIVRNPLGPSEPSSPHLKVGANDGLLVVIHGYGAQGWRDPEATQTYLLKNSVGSGMEPRSARDVIDQGKGKKAPPLKGDVIAQVIQNQPGYLYFSMSTYNWYDPKTYAGEPELRRGHGGLTRRTNR